MSIERFRSTSNRTKKRLAEEKERRRYALMHKIDSTMHKEFEDDVDKYKIEVGILIIATHKYTKYIQELIHSMEENFLVNNKKNYYIFSNKKMEIECKSYYEFLDIDHKPFPYPTLYRFHFFDRYMQNIRGDQLIYIDVDSVIKSPIGTEILTERTVVQHCGFVGRVGSFEENKESACYVSSEKRINYYGGGFYSFNRDEFIKLTSNCKSIIDEDESNGIVPIWHDESALNKYMSENIPTRILSPSYHWPENRPYIYNLWGSDERYKCKILLIDKDNEIGMK